MLRPTLANAHIKRTCRPRLANTQATPKPVLLDANWDRSVDIYPGMGLMKTTGSNVTLINGTGVLYGLSAFFEAPMISMNEISNQGVNAAAIWILGPDSEFEILAPAFDTSVSWVDPGDGTVALVSAYTSGAKRGQLCPAGTSGAATVPIARLIEVVSASKIVVGGLQGRVA